MEEFGPEWRRKIRHLAKMLDFDGDGEITRKDFERFGDRFVEVGKLKGVKAKQVRGKLIKWWDDFMGEAERQGQRVTPENYPDMFAKKTKEHVRYMATLYGGLYFDLIDLNGDGVIQKSEFEIFYEVLDFDVSAAAESFKALDTDGDGVLSYDEFVNALIDFFESEDSTGPASMLFGPLKD